MQFQGLNIVLTLAYAAPVVFFAWRGYKTQKKWFEKQTEISETEISIRNLDSIPSLRSNQKYQQEGLADLVKDADKLTNKTIRIGIYFILFTILFFWRPLKIENNPYDVSSMRESFIREP